MKLGKYIVGLIALTSVQANAAVAITVNTVPTAFRLGAVADQTIAWDLTVGADDILVSSLGYFDYDGDGLESPSNVAIFQDLGASGQVNLGEVTITGSAGAMVGNFRYVDLAVPVLLSAGTTYRIAGNTGNDGGNSNSLPFTGGAPLDFTADPAIASAGPDFQATSTFGGSVVYPFFELNNAGVFELPLVNVQYDVSTIPEPSSSLLIGLCGGLFALRRRRS